MFCSISDSFLEKCLDCGQRTKLFGVIFIALNNSFRFFRVPAYLPEGKKKVGKLLWKITLIVFKVDVDESSHEINFTSLSIATINRDSFHFIWLFSIPRGANTCFLYLLLNVNVIFFLEVLFAVKVVKSYSKTPFFNLVYVQPRLSSTTSYEVHNEYI